MVKPTKRKIIFAIILYFLDKGLMLAIGYFRGSGLVLQENITIYFLDFILNLIWMYPLACLLALKDRYKEKRFWWEALIIILIFNPITFRFISILFIMLS